MFIRGGDAFASLRIDVIVDWSVESRKAVQLLFPFLIALLPLLSARRDGLFLVSVFEEVLRLYLTVLQERCVDDGAMEVLCRRKSRIAA